MIVVNAGMFLTVKDFLDSFRIAGYEIRSYCDKIAKIDIQGPKSLILMERLFGSEMFDSFPYFSFKGSLDDLLISRSGYTGEFGFEIYIDSDRGVEMWNRILKSGEDLGIMCCGLAARDSLRVGAGLPLSHRDIGDWEFCNTPWDFALEKSFKSETSYTYAYTGFDVRKLTHGDGDVIRDGVVIGRVLSCVSEVSLTRVNKRVYSGCIPDLPKYSKIKGLAAGFILVNRPLDYGEIVILSDEKKKSGR